MSRSIRLQAPAKLNLALSVGPAGVDRMHPIASWMVTIDLHDDIMVYLTLFQECVAHGGELGFACQRCRRIVIRYCA